MDVSKKKKSFELLSLKIKISSIQCKLFWISLSKCYQRPSAGKRWAGLCIITLAVQCCKTTDFLLPKS